MDANRWQALFADLETEFDAADAEDLSAEVADRTRREYALLRLLDRLRPAVQRPVSLQLPAGVSVSGRLADLGADWVMVSEEGAPGPVLVALRHVVAIGGLGHLSAAPGSEGHVGARLDLRHALRRLARSRAPVTVVLLDGSRLTGTIDRVGFDFLELAEHPTGEPRRARSVRQVRAVVLSAVAVVRVG